MSTVSRFRHVRESVPSNSSARVGLTSRQAWALEHITRCPSCGRWVLVSDQTLWLITGDGYVPPAVCEHFQPPSVA